MHGSHKNKYCYQLKNSISERATNYLDFFYFGGKKSVGFCDNIGFNLNGKFFGDFYGNLIGLLFGFF